MTTSVSTSADDSGHIPTAETIASYLQEHAASYFEEFETGDVHVNLSREWKRENSRLYRFALESEKGEHFVFVKVPSARGQLRGNDRPYLIPETDPARKFQLHIQGLKTIDQNLGHLDAQSFGTVRFLDQISGSGALVMEEAQGRTLRQWLNEAHRLRFASPDVLRLALRNAGVWLRAFHEIPDGASVQTVHERRYDFESSVEAFADFLTALVDDRHFIESAASQAIAAAKVVLPEHLPLGLRFGDFGLTNILVAPTGKITPIDTMACWRAPIYEDIAWLLTALKAYKVQLATQGLAFSSKRILELEQAFLVGYFGDDALPRREVALYEILRFMERWAAKVASLQRRKSLIGKARYALTNRFFRDRINASLEGIARDS